MDFQGCLSLLGVIGGLVSAACAVVSVFQARKSKEEREVAEKVAQSLEVLADASARQQQAPPWELRWTGGDRYLLVNTGADTVNDVIIECPWNLFASPLRVAKARGVLTLTRLSPSSMQHRCRRMDQEVSAYAGHDSMELAIHGSPRFLQNITDTAQERADTPQLNASNVGIASTASNGMWCQCR